MTAFIAAGCAPDSPDVVSLEATGSAQAADTSGADARYSAAAAEAYYQCMGDAGIPVMLTTLPDGQVQVDWDIRVIRSGMARDPDGAEVIISPPSDEIIERYFADSAADYVLVVEGRDFSEEYQSCRTQSGYQAPVQASDPAAELRAKQAIVAVSNAWAECARENGLPDLADAGPLVADNYQTQPVVLLPLDLTEDALKALLTACSPVGREHLEAAAGRGDPNTEWIDPSIDFDYPGRDGTGPGPSAAEIEQYNRLSAILFAD